jgi:putative pyruvate formate lyase activating enzyme
MEASLLELKNKAGEAWEILSACRLCPRECDVDRLKGEKGSCALTSGSYISSFGAHFGEEPPLVGRHGSGTIFFTSCNLHCCYCQNYDISQLRVGYKITAEALAEVMLSLEARGCHNINLVTPTHQVPQILKALVMAVGKGLRLPIVYNCGGYESLEVIKLLDGVVSIYMPDIKYADPEVAKKLSAAPDYPRVVKKVVKEMHRQVGDLIINENGVAEKGLLIRHLVLPNRLAGTKEVVRFIAGEISKDSYVNIMDQYRPCYLADNYERLARRITRKEYKEAIDWAKKEGLHRGFIC